MEDDLELGLAGEQWVVLSYALALSALYLPSGAVGDRIGLRRLFLAGTVVFAAASAICAFATGSESLLVGRVLQGVGGAALTTSSLALLRVTWAGNEGRAIGLWTSLTSVATVGGPALGGLLVELASWRWVFVVNLPLAALVVGLGLAGRTEEERSVGRSTLDPIGSALAAVGLAGISFALVEARSGDGGVVALTGAGGCAALVALALWTLRAPDPLVPPRLLREPGLAAANVVTVVLYAALGAQLLFFPVYLQFLGFSAFVAGLVFTVPSLGLVLLAARAGRLADRIGPRRPIAAGALLIAAAQLVLLFVDDERSAWKWATLSLVLIALGLAAIVAPVTAAALAPAPNELAGVASGLNQTAARAGGVLSVAGVGALAGWMFARSGGIGDAPFDPALAGVSREAGIDAFRLVAVSVALLAALAALLAILLLDDRRRVLEQGALEPEEGHLAIETPGVADK